MLILSMAQVSWGDDYTIHSKVYFGGVNAPTECVQLDDLSQRPDYSEQETLSARLQVSDFSGENPSNTESTEEEMPLISDSMNSYIETTSRL
jgi:hypothetical protein